ncbi:hypothetical protein GNI_090820 [Gregarina niphandrodes]|uniref:Uncharacterized protein n=1 Tax=Gregarina niphandrodes TaxID=110365 RepID=A0A023B5G8_GRENI|nr:hypothetical protein GNI_090820 [Gregarina niphandrodes]EZG60239.1 hypothetical protein GNI_090820 [Gregarina niphandrodes]|eukprot:XP_011130842.1 hypothetical protein GNI_090820 [Gregarina niphandrodes]
MGDMDYRVVNIGVQGAVRPGSELRVAELYLTLKKWFKHWKVLYYPDLSPYLTMMRSLPRDPCVSGPKLPSTITNTLRPVQLAVYETLAKEAAEDAQYAQILAQAGAPPNSPVGTVPEADTFLHSTGRAAVYLVNPTSLAIHRVQEEHEMYAAWGFILPLLTCFLEEGEPTLYATLIQP